MGEDMEMIKILGECGLADAARDWAQNWQLSSTGFNPGKLYFLEPTFLRESCEAMGFDEEIADAILGAAVTIRNDENLQRVAWHCHCLLSGVVPPEKVASFKWPLPTVEGEFTKLIYAPVFVGAYPETIRKHRERDIPAEISTDTFSDLPLWMRHYRGVHGVWGVDQTAWLGNHFRGRLFKLGRLQYESHGFGHESRALRNRVTGKVLVLAGDGLCFRSDGEYDGTNGVFDPDAWTSVFSVSGGVITGNPFSPRGAAQRETVTLDAGEWEVILQKGDTVLGFHIPACGPLLSEDCGKSLEMAAAFFPRHFPEIEFKAFVSGSWLFDAQFEDYLPPESNIVKFLREFYLMASPHSSDSQFFERVFGGHVADLDQAPQDSSLRRAGVALMKKGGRWRNVGALYFPEDLDWGKQVYRRMHTVDA
jgi:hypothetical protein